MAWLRYLLRFLAAGNALCVEHGDPDYPIWAGCRWGSQSDIPSLAKAGNPADPNIVIQST